MTHVSGYVVYGSKMAKKKDAEKASQNDSNNRNSSAENGDRDEDSFSDPEGFVDDVSDEGECGWNFAIMCVHMAWLERFLQKYISGRVLSWQKCFCSNVWLRVIHSILVFTWNVWKTQECVDF